MGNTVISSFQVGKEAQRKVQYAKVPSCWVAQEGFRPTSDTGLRITTSKLNQDYLIFKQEEKSSL